MAAYYTQDCVVYDPFYLEPLKGRAAIEKDAADFFRAFPDLRVEVETHRPHPAASRLAGVSFATAGGLELDRRREA